MTPSTRAQLKMSDLRKEARALMDLDLEKRPEDYATQLQELEKRFAEAEAEWRACTVMEQPLEARADALDAEEKEKLSLLRGTAVQDYIQHAVVGTSLGGKPAELNAAFEVRQSEGGVVIPWELLYQPSEKARAELRMAADHPQMETRADVSTTSSAVGAGTQQRPILQRLFGPEILDILGVRIDNVPAGLAAWPLISGGVAAEMVAEGTKQDADGATFVTSTLMPKRLTGVYQWTVELRARVLDIEDALRRDLASAIRAGMQNQVIQGSGVGQQVTGLTAVTALAAVGQATKFTAAEVGALASLGVDAIHATNDMEVSVLFGPETYRAVAAEYFASTSDSALKILKQNSGACMASNYIPAAASVNDKDATAQDNNQQYFLHAGMDTSRGDSIAAMWPGVEVIRDNITGHQAGLVKLNWTVLWDCKMAHREGAYKRAFLKIA